MYNGDDMPPWPAGEGSNTKHTDVIAGLRASTLDDGGWGRGWSMTPPVSRAPVSPPASSTSAISSTKGRRDQLAAHGAVAKLKAAFDTASRLSDADLLAQTS
ncbi:MAG TPA: hypothetical protein VLC92_21400 [Rhodocyclaceae bacterium]|nr:hypothetical protein [Rhodocyclaceae bacterium]